jgi:tRNA uridine 5-carbamoylmethylation protein Kti12
VQQNASTGDVSVINQLLRVLEAVMSNTFYDFDQSLKTVIPVLMNLTLQSDFNAESVIRSIIDLKDRTASLLSRLIKRFHQKYELKVDYAEFLVEQLLKEDLHPISAYGCLASISSFGEHITGQILCPRVA